MARFFSYDEIVNKELTPVDDIQLIAGQIAGLPAFVDGSAVLCGSVSWGKPSWRSDIDVAHFSTLTYSHIGSAIDNVIQQYLENTNHQFIAPRVDVIPIGAESLSSVNKSGTVPISVISLGLVKKGDLASDIFMENAVLFADHIGSIASLKGEPWKSFYDRYLSAVSSNQFDRRQSIRNYVERMTTEWIRQPLHYLNLSPNKEFDTKHLNLISKSENYAVNLMRRILGELGCYPLPDRASDVQTAFSNLDAPWIAPLMNQFEPFFQIDKQYEEIIAACKQSFSPISSAEYYERLRNLFIDLPFVEIQNIIWEYVRA
jgi:hypothetical protein